MVYKRIHKILKIGILTLAVIISSLFLFGRITQACTLAEPVTCLDGTVYNCGFYRADGSAWVCGIRHNPVNPYCSDTLSATDDPECSNADVWYRQGACPDTNLYNGEVCQVADGADPPFGCIATGVRCWGQSGVWDASEKQCATCSGNSQDKRLGDTTQRCIDLSIGDFFAGCPISWSDLACATISGTCESACGASTECDEANNGVGVVVPGGVCDNCVYTPCTWGAWTNDVCGGAPCAASEMRQTRTTNPVGCTTSTQCVSDTGWTAWTNDACGAGGCTATQMRQTRTGTPYGCAADSQCVNDTCTAWADDACGAGGCTSDQMYQTRSCTYDCLSESQCTPVCTAWVDGLCGAAGGCNPGETEQTRTCPAGCGPDAQCVASGACNSENNYLNGCTNLTDDEGDGCVDSQDSDCGGRETDCIDDRDNDCDGFTDGNDPDCPAGIITFENPLEAGTIPEIIAAIGDFIFFVGLGLVTLMILIAGIMFMTAGGDPYKIGRAKNLLFWTAIGAGITLFSKGVSAIIRYLLGG